MQFHLLQFAYFQIRKQICSWNTTDRNGPFNHYKSRTNWFIWLTYVKRITKTAPKIDKDELNIFYKQKDAFFEISVKHIKVYKTANPLKKMMVHPKAFIHNIIIVWTTRIKTTGALGREDIKPKKTSITVIVMIAEWAS